MTCGGNHARHMHKYMKIQVFGPRHGRPALWQLRLPSLPRIHPQSQGSLEPGSWPKVSASCCLQVPEVTWLRPAARLTDGGRTVFSVLRVFR